MQQQSSQKGFSLIELSLFLVLVSLLSVSFLQGQKIAERQNRASQKDYLILGVTDALSKYLSLKGHYPCPAPLYTDISDPLNGKATDCSLTAPPGVKVVTGTGGKEVRIGAVPYKDLFLGREDVIDIYGSRFLYVVTKEQAIASHAGGGFSIDDDAGAIIVERQYQEYDPVADKIKTYTDTDNKLKHIDAIFLSHGPDRKGAVNESGNIYSACSSQVGRDIENCDLSDAKFLVTNLYSTNDDSNHYDDTVIYDIWRWISVWDIAAADSSNSIYSRNQGKIGVGLTEPEERLHVNGNLRIDGNNPPPDNRPARARSSEICDESNALDCFEPWKLGDEDGYGIGCFDGNGNEISDKMVVAIEGGDVRCGSVTGNVTGSCDGPYGIIKSYVFNYTTGSYEAVCEDYITGVQTQKTW